MNTREKILEVAAHLFSSKGFRNTNISEIAENTGVAEGTIFYHFTSKEGLFLAILRKFRSSLTNDFSEYGKSSHFRSGLDRTEHLVSFYLSYSASMEERFLFLHRHDAYELSEVNQLFREELEAIYTCFVDVFDSAILEGQKDGSISDDFPPRKVAMILFALVDSVARLNTYRLYDADSLFNELLMSCKRILSKGT